MPWNDLYVATTTAGRRYAGVLVDIAGEDFMMRVSEDPQDWIAIGSAEDLPDGASSGESLTVSTKRF